MPKPQAKETKANRPFVIDVSYEIFNLAVVLLSLINLPLLWLLPLPEQRNVVIIVEVVISAYLFCDAIYRLARAPIKSRFLWHFQGWLFFVGSMPVPLLRLVRLIPVWLALRRLKKSDLTHLGEVVLAHPAHSTLFGVLLAALAVLQVGSLWILGAESGAPNANIRTASDALWWGIVTIGTVGYGDRYPVTTDGRIAGIVVIVTGVALFTTLTSFLAQSFITSRRKPPPDSPSDRQELSNQLRALQEAMERRDREQTRLIRELQAQVEALRQFPTSDA